MFSLEVMLMGFGLAMDAAVVSFALGLLCGEMPWHHKTQRGIISALTFGFFQFAMLWLGSYGGFLFSFSAYGYLSHFIVATIFLILAFKFIHDSNKDDKAELEWGIIPLLLLGFATSFDALAAGMSLGTLPHPYIAAFGVGIITALMSATTFFGSQIFQNLPDKWLLRLAAVIFMFLGGKIVMDQISRGII